MTVPQIDRKWTYRYVKRFMDLTLAICASLLLFPLFLIIAALIRLSSPGPVLFRWPVVGKGGQPFEAYKFRTMIPGADAMKEQLRDWNEAVGPVFKMKDDPRITPVGRFLRRFSLDELPQLWSVIKGDMSLVGPRPVLTYEWEQFTDWQRKKLSVKPGAVCLWHVRDQPRDLDAWVALDLEYIENWSLWLDLKIILGTLWYIISGKNY